MYCETVGCERHQQAVPEAEHSWEWAKVPFGYGYDRTPCCPDCHRPLTTRIPQPAERRRA